MRLIGLVLLVLGILACVYGGFWYPKHDATKVDLGPVQVRIQERTRVNLPLWVGAASIVAGAVLLVLRRPTP